MTNTEIIIKAGEVISLLIQANPEYTKEQLMAQAYLAGLAEGGKIVAARVKAFGATLKARIS